MRTAPVEREPTDQSRVLAVAAGTVATVIVAGYAPVAGAVAVVGLLGVVLGVVRGLHGAVTVGAATILGGVLYAGVNGAPPLPLVLGVAATVLAWDLGGFSIDLGEQLGREADTRRLEAVHAGGSVAVAAVTAGLGYGVYATATGGQPVGAVLLLLLAGMFVVGALDRP